MGKQWLEVKVQEEREERERGWIAWIEANREEKVLDAD